MSITDLSGIAWRKSSCSASSGNCVEVGLWKKSSYSSNAGNCVEVGLWKKSSHSGNGANCVEVSARPAEPDLRSLARDSKNPTGPVLAFPTAAWTSFQRAIASD